MIAVLAAACVSPTTLGTDTDAGPEETTRATGEPLAALVPAAGVSLITSPLATEALDALVTATTVSPAPVIAVVAAAWVSPTTLGTLTWAAPLPSDPPQAVTADARRTISAALAAICLDPIKFTAIPFAVRF